MSAPRRTLGERIELVGACVLIALALLLVLFG